MPTDSAEPLGDVDPDTVDPDDVAAADVRAALGSDDPLAQRRAVEVCETLADAGVDAVEPHLDAVAALTHGGHSAVALGAIAVLDTVAEEQPGALADRIAPLAEATGMHIVDVQLTSASALAKVVVDRPDLVAPHAPTLLRAIGSTEPTRELTDFGEVVDDPVTRRTLREKEEEERERRLSARRTLINVVVAAAEGAPDAVPDVVDELVALRDDVDPGVAAGAADALAELAAADADRVDAATDPLLDCLDHERSAVRARAIRALGHLGADAAVPRLRALATEDGDADVREIAADTADFLAESA